jgi:hypothetical protein
MSHWEEECEVFRREDIMLYVQHTREGLDEHTDLSINQSVYEP